MRTIITRIAFIFILFCGFASVSQAQNVYTEKYPKWRIGLNGGGMWQTNDIKKNYAGFAGGFNVERILNKREDAPIGFSLGFRYLGGRSYGYDNNKNYGLQYNTALNGTKDSLVHYDSIPGYFYNNYSTRLGEGALELKINFPAMEKNTRLIFHVFGGVGVAKYRTKIDALDQNGVMYDYSKLSPSPTTGDLKSFYGTNFETYADASNSNGTQVFTPSVGLGLGVRISKNVSFVFEHRVSFPLTNTLDGQQYTNTNTKLQGNDIYHYTSANLVFTIWGKSRNNTTYTPNTTTTTNTVTTNNNANNVVVNTNQPKPIINVYNPVSNPSVSYTNVQQVSGTIQYVDNANGISINVNGTPVTNYNFNPNNGSFSFGANLIAGANSVNITASNSAGQDNESLTVNYSMQDQVVPVTNELPPNVLITYPANNYATNVPSVNVNATVTNITSSSNIAISVNGYAVSNFNFNSYNGSVSFVAPLNPGNNSIIVSAFNSAGNDAEQVFVMYNGQSQIVAPVEIKPVVSFHNPPVSPFQSTTNTFSVTAHVSNVTSANQVAVQYNGVAVTNFTFNQYGFVNFTVNLNQGSNTVVVTGTNTSGSDTKMATIDFREAGFPPVVTFVNPTINPASVTTANTNVIATVTNVDNQNNISVTVNNVPVAFTYNTANKTVTIPASLNIGNNNVSVSATTNFGNDTKTQVIERKEPVQNLKPIVTVLSPASNPYVTSVTNVPVIAQVQNAMIKHITVTNPANVGIQFNYDPATLQVSFTPVLNPGMNTFTIKASNAGGTDSKTVTIEYKETVIPITLPKPSVTIVNPGVNPYITPDGQIVVKAITTNVSSQQEIAVNVNGSSANFTFNPANKEIDIPVTLNIGSNSISITVSNKGGVDNKTQVIERTRQAPQLMPVVTLINPQSSPYQTPMPSYAVSAEILNVHNTSGVSVMQGQTPVVFNYNTTSHVVTFTANLAAGSNTYVIKGTNLAGSDSKELIINYVKKAAGTGTVVEKPVVTITNPASVNTTSAANTQNVTATVTNVDNASQVSVMVNGVPKTDFGYASGTVTFTANLNLGNNTIAVSAANPAGSDSKTVSVLYKKTSDGNTGTVIVAKPAVTFLNPNQPSTTVNDNPTQNVSAFVSNVNTASQVTVKVNNAAITNFTFANGTVNFPASLNLGNNTVSVTGTNPAGSDTKTIAILYKKASDGNNGTVTLPKPVVTFLNPAQASTTHTESQIQNILASVTNVTGANEISVKVNTIPVTNFSFAAGNVTFGASLNLGNNTVTVTGANAAGSDSKSITIIYKKATDGSETAQKPVVTITSVNTTTPASSQAVSASITNIQNASQVAVMVNGSPYTGFNYNNGSVSLNASLNVGSNEIVITGTNLVGSDSKKVNIIRKAIPKPVVTILEAMNGPRPVGSKDITIKATVQNVNSSNEITVIGSNGSTIPFTYNSSTTILEAPTTMPFDLTTYTVSASNASGSDSKSVSFQYTTTPTPVENPNDAGSKMTICHYPPDGGSPQRMTINASDWPTHQAHGDSEGNCGTNNSVNGGNNNTEEQISICHYPPGNTNNPQQITIPASAWPAHQAHGDVLGACPTNTNNGNGNNGNGNNNGNGGNNGNGNNNADEQISICHYPPGNTSNPQQITIPASAWPAHQAHGDVLGGCPQNKPNDNNGNGGKGGNGNNGNGGKGNTGNTGNGGKTNTVINPGNIFTPKTTNTGGNQVTPKKEETSTPKATPKTVNQPKEEPKKEETKKEEGTVSPSPRMIKPR